MGWVRGSGRRLRDAIGARTAEVMTRPRGIPGASSCAPSRCPGLRPTFVPTSPALQLHNSVLFPPPKPTAQLLLGCGRPPRTSLRIRIFYHKKRDNIALPISNPSGLPDVGRSRGAFAPARTASRMKSMESSRQDILKFVSSNMKIVNSNRHGIR